MTSLLIKELLMPLLERMRDSHFVDSEDLARLAKTLREADRPIQRSNYTPLEQKKAQAK